MRRLMIAVAALALIGGACGGDDDGGPSRTFDDSGMDQNGCSPEEEFSDESGLCEPGPCLQAAQDRMDRASERGDDV
jgi:hypothetical protein